MYFIETLIFIILKKLMILKVIVGIPAYNEEKNIAKVIVQLQKITNRILVCNDGSNDLTGEISEKMGADVINHPKNLGYGTAIGSIFEKSSKSDCDILVTFDADGQHRVADIAKVIQPILDGTADLVIGSRFLEEEDSKNIPKYRKIGIKAITSITDSVIDTKLTDSQSGFRAYNKKILDTITPSERGMGVSTELLIKASKQGFRIKEVPIKILYEGDTSTHNPISHGTSVILSTMKYTSIEHPLKFYGLPGILFLITGTFFIIWTIQTFTETRQIITNISLIGIGSMILGTILSVTAIMLYSLVSVVRENNKK